MAVKSLYTDRIYSKVRNILHKKFFWRYGLGNRVPRSIWEKQFNHGMWDYLYNEAEAAHYQVISRNVQQYAPGKSLLDIGCGQGVLYHYLKQHEHLQLNYSGIDLSAEAITIATRQFPEANFSQLDFDRKKLDKKFDVIVFNETLYYFDRPLKTIEKVIRHNLSPNGYLIISMCDYLGHDVIWGKLTKNYKPLKMDTVENQTGQKWKIAVFKP